MGTKIGDTEKCRGALPPNAPREYGPAGHVVLSSEPHESAKVVGHARKRTRNIAQKPVR